jgi:outer membrane protein assembly factor BamB
MSSLQSRRSTADRTLADLIFVGFNSRVIALDRYSGELVWEWKSPEGRGYVTLAVDGDRVIAAVMGYIYCLDPLFGQEVWRNTLPKKGVGVTSIASSRASASGGDAIAMAAAAIAAQQAASAG